MTGLGASRPDVTAAEREVADLLPIEASLSTSQTILERVPFWFHTFCLNREKRMYTPGAARDHRYRIPLLPADLRGMRVLDVGTFDGFYAFLAERRGGSRVVAVDNEQYRHWVKARWNVELSGGEGFRAIHETLGSRVEYRCLDGFELAALGEKFDLVLCFGLLHRVDDPVGLLRVLREMTDGGGAVLVETYGVRPQAGSESWIHVPEPGGTYQGDEFVYWGFGRTALDRLARTAGFSRSACLAEVAVDGHPRIVCSLSP